MGNFKYLLFPFFTLVMFNFAPNLKANATRAGMFGVPDSLAQELGENVDRFEIIGKDSYCNEEKVLIPRGESIIVSERTEPGQLQILVAPRHAPDRPAYGESGGNTLVGYNQDGSLLFESAIPLKQSDPVGLLGW